MGIDFSERWQRSRTYGPIDLDREGLAGGKGLRGFGRADHHTLSGGAGGKESESEEGLHDGTSQRLVVVALEMSGK